MRHHDDRAVGLVHELLEPVEAGEVEVVGRLVEQQHVEAAEQDRRERGAAPPGRPRAPRPRRRAGRRPGPRSAHTAPMRASRSSPPSARNRSSASVYASAWVGSVAERGGEPVELRRSRSATPVRRAEVAAQRLAGPGVGLLGQEADGQRTPARARPRRASSATSTREHAQQRRLADAVRADDAEPVARGDGHRHVVQHEPAAERDRHALGRQHARDPIGPPSADRSCSSGQPIGRGTVLRTGLLEIRRTWSGRDRLADRGRLRAPSRGPGSTSSARWKVICSRTDSGTSSRSGPLRFGQHDRGEAGPLRREHLLLEPADRQHPTLQRDLAGHPDVGPHRASGEPRHERRGHRDAGRRSVLRAPRPRGRARGSAAGPARPRRPRAHPSSPGCSSARSPPTPS